MPIVLHITSQTTPKARQPVCQALGMSAVLHITSQTTPKACQSVCRALNMPIVPHITSQTTPKACQSVCRALGMSAVLHITSQTTPKAHCGLDDMGCMMCEQSQYFPMAVCCEPSPPLVTSIRCTSHVQAAARTLRSAVSRKLTAILRCCVSVRPGVGVFISCIQD